MFVTCIVSKPYIWILKKYDDIPVQTYVKFEPFMCESLFFVFSHKNLLILGMLARNVLSWSFYYIEVINISPIVIVFYSFHTKTIPLSTLESKFIFVSRSCKDFCFKLYVVKTIRKSDITNLTLYLSSLPFATSEVVSYII